MRTDSNTLPHDIFSLSISHSHIILSKNIQSLLWGDSGVFSLRGFQFQYSDAMRTSFSNSGLFKSLSAVAQIIVLIAPAVSRAQDDKINNYDKELSIGLVHPCVQSWS